VPEDNNGSGHRERVRASYVRGGLDSWEEYAVLELILFYSIARRDTKQLAKDLIKKYGSLSGVFDAPYESLVNFPGVGERTASLLKLLLDVSRRYSISKVSAHDVLDSAEKAGDYISAHFVGLTNEQVFILCLDGKNKVLYDGFISSGTVNLASVSARTVAELALLHRASSVILAHNHPNGFAIPSEKDRVATLKIFTTLKAVGIPLLDHIIVVPDDYVSMAQSGFFSNK